MSKTTHQQRKEIVVYTGFMKYFPKAIRAVAHLSFIANEQHNPGEPVHWDKSKSTDHLDCQFRHTLDHAEGITIDDDNIRHLTKNAWRAMAELQMELEREEEYQEYLDEYSTKQNFFERLKDLLVPTSYCTNKDQLCDEERCYCDKF